MAEDAGQWVVAWNSSWLHDALFVKSLLGSEGIEVQIPNEHTVGVHSLLANAIGGIRVRARLVVGADGRYSTVAKQPIAGTAAAARASCRAHAVAL